VRTAGPQRYRAQIKPQGFWIDFGVPLGQHAMNIVVATLREQNAEFRVVDHETGAPTETKF
jgi:hypothetical protein